VTDPIPAFTSLENAKRLRTKSEQRYVNKKMEAELAAYKVEIERRFAKSTINEFGFPRKKQERGDQQPVDMLF